MNDKLNKNRKTIIITLVVVWLAIVLYAVGFFVFTIGKTEVTVKYAPFAARVSLNDTVIMNNHGNYITPGEYHLVVEYENFQTIEKNILIDENTKYLFGGLIAANEAGEAYLKEHLEEYYEMQGIAGEMATIQGNNQREKYPIIEKLPVKDPYYNIGYNLNDEGGVEVTVEAAIAYRQLAVSGLLELMSDDDFGKYDVIFYDLESPYAGKFVDNEEADPVEYIKTGFAGVGVDFTVNGGESEGEYYYAYLRYYYREFANVIYRIVLKNTDGGWELVAEPYPVLTTANTPGVPLEIINKVNKL